MGAKSTTSGFWILVGILYALSIGFSYSKIYIYGNYPTFYTEDEIPGLLDPVKQLFK